MGRIAFTRNETEDHHVSSPPRPIRPGFNRYARARVYPSRNVADPLCVRLMNARSVIASVIAALMTARAQTPVVANPERRHLDESQRALVAARLANMGGGRPDKDNRLNLADISKEQAARLANLAHGETKAARGINLAISQVEAAQSYPARGDGENAPGAGERHDDGRLRHHPAAGTSTGAGRTSRSSEWPPPRPRVGTLSVTPHRSGRPGNPARGRGVCLCMSRTLLTPRSGFHPARPGWCRAPRPARSARPATGPVTPRHGPTPPPPTGRRMTPRPHGLSASGPASDRRGRRGDGRHGARLDGGDGGGDARSSVWWSTRGISQDAGLSRGWWGAWGRPWGLT